MRIFAALIATIGTLAILAPAQSQSWPSRPITMIVPFPPGPALDQVARLVAAKIAGPLGQTIVIENRTGANGAIGSNSVARAAPDGYTLLAATAGTHVTAPYLVKSLPYDPVKDFDFVHGQLSEEVARYYWIKARNRSGYYGDWYPSGVMAGFF